MPERIGRGNPEVERIITEMDALNTALRARDPQDIESAVALVRHLRETRGEPETFEEFMILACMQKILGEPIVTMPPKERPLGVMEYEAIGLAWVAWAADRPNEAFNRVRGLMGEPEPGTLGGTGAIQTMTLHYWARGIEALAVGAKAEAERLFRRAAEVGSSFGTDSHPVVLWTMAASFFPKPTAT